MREGNYCYIKEKSSSLADCMGIEPGADRILGRCTDEDGACYVPVSPSLLPKLPGILETNYVVLLSHLRDITRVDLGNVCREGSIVLSTSRLHFLLTAIPMTIYLCLGPRLTTYAKKGA